MSYTVKDSIQIEALSKALVHSKEGFKLEKKRKIRLYEFTATGTPQNCAIEISKFETKLFKQLKLDNSVYTIFMGPAEYSDQSLKVRLGLVFGIHGK